jgi:hypothetical protein
MLKTIQLDSKNLKVIQGCPAKVMITENTLVIRIPFATKETVEKVFEKLEE